MQPKRQNGRWDPTSSVGFWINHASRMLLRAHEARLRPVGFGMSHLPVLVALEYEEALTQKELALRARVEQPTMAEALTRMERDGVVQRKPNPEDRRGSLVSLTSLARARFPEAKVELAKNEAAATAGFTEKEKELLRALLQRVVTNLEAAQEQTAKP